MVWWLKLRLLTFVVVGSHAVELQALPGEVDGGA